MARIERFRFYMDYPNQSWDAYHLQTFATPQVIAEMVVDGKKLTFNQHVNLDESPDKSEIEYVMDYITRMLIKGYREGQL